MELGAYCVGGRLRSVLVGDAGRRTRPDGVSARRRLTRDSALAYVSSSDPANKTRKSKMSAPTLAATMLPPVDSVHPKSLCSAKKLLRNLLSLAALT